MKSLSLRTQRKIMSKGIKIFAGQASKGLAEKIASSYKIGLGDVTKTVFSDGEFQVSFEETVRGQDVFIVQSTMPPSDNLMELLIIADALRRSSAARITAVIPYFGYARQDRRSKARTPITAKLVANMMVEAGIERILTLDLHATQIQGFFDIPVDNLYASPIFALDVMHNFKGNRDDLMVVSPDVGGVARARDLAQRIGAPLSIVDKRRGKPGEVAEMTVIGDVKDRTCLIVDDIVDTAGTLCKAAEVLMEHGALSVRAFCTHAVLSGPAYERLTNSAITELVVTDSIPLKQSHDKIRVLTVTDLFADVIHGVVKNESISSHFIDLNNKQ